MSAGRDEGGMHQQVQQAGSYLDWELRGSSSVGLAIAVSAS